MLSQSTQIVCCGEERNEGCCLANGTMEPTLDEIEAEYQWVCWLALRCIAGLELQPFTIGVTSPIISHALNMSGPSQLTEASNHQLAGITNVVASH